jgi:hypothetical protein
MGSLVKKIGKSSRQYSVLIEELNKRLNEIQKGIDPEKNIDLADQVRKEIELKNEQRRKDRNKRKAR